MTKVIIFKDRHGIIKKYTIKGHANYREYGEDIVCSAISVLAVTTLNSLEEVCGLNEEDIDYSIDEETGYLDVNLPIDIDGLILDKTQIVLRVLEVGIKSIIESYPEYITLEYGEV